MFVDAYWQFCIMLNDKGQAFLPCVIHVNQSYWSAQDSVQDSVTVKEGGIHSQPHNPTSASNLGSSITFTYADILIVFVIRLIKV